jgi:DNA-binding NarL/FixJ family response regulator
METPHILLVEDEKTHVELIRFAFDVHHRRFDLTVTESIHEAQAELKKSIPHLVITDYFLPDGEAVELLPAGKEKFPYPVLVMTSHGDEKIEVEAMKMGAMDYLVKTGTTLFDIPQIVERILREWGNIIERKKLEEALHNIATGVSAKTGEAFFLTLVQYLAKALNMDYAHIAELVPGEKETVKTIAAFHHGKMVENFEYHLADTPCGNVYHRGFCLYPDGVTGLFPKDTMLKEMGAVSYAGTQLVDSAGCMQGLMLIIGRQPLDNPDITKSIIDVFSVRATAELERRKREEELRKLSLTVKEDITRLKHVEEDLRRAKEETEEATKLKDKFVGNVQNI